MSNSPRPSFSSYLTALLPVNPLSLLPISTSTSTSSTTSPTAFTSSCPSTPRRSHPPLLHLFKFFPLMEGGSSEELAMLMVKYPSLYFTCFLQFRGKKLSWLSSPFQRLIIRNKLTLFSDLRKLVQSCSFILGLPFLIQLKGKVPVMNHLGARFNGSFNSPIRKYRRTSRHFHFFRQKLVSNHFHYFVYLL